MSWSGGFWFYVNVSNQNGVKGSFNFFGFNFRNYPHCQHFLQDGFPTLCIYNVSNGQEVCASDGSFYNDQEATFVVFMIEALLASGLEPSSIGVITLYKAQMRKIHQLLLASG